MANTKSEHAVGATSKTAVKEAPDGAVEKRRVVMKSVFLVQGTTDQYAEHSAVDYVPTEMLDAYVADAKTRWQSVTVPQPDHHDPGPGGDEAETVWPEHLAAGVNLQDYLDEEG